MKKVLAFVAIALLCGLSRAAVIQWNVMAIRENGTALSGVTAYLYVTTPETDMTSTWEAIASGADATTLAGYMDSAVTSSTGNIPWQQLADMDNHNGFPTSTTYDAYLVVIDGDRFAYLDPRSFTTPAWVETNEQDVNIPFGFVNLQDDDWNAIVAIPEPTALALLALGIAGVALRRRA